MDKITIYAELSKKQYVRILSGEYAITVPRGVKMTNKKGSRGLFFYCDNEKLFSLMENGLKTSGINFQKIKTENEK